MNEEELTQEPEQEQEQEVPTYNPSTDAFSKDYVPQNTYAPPTIRGEQSQWGLSSVDLSIKENVDKMWEEHKVFSNGITWRTPDEIRNDPKRLELENNWYQKYYGMSKEDYDLKKDEYIKSRSNPFRRTAETVDESFQALSVPGLAWADFGVDAVTTVVPGTQGIDDAWDERTELDNPFHQGARRMLSVVLPSMYAGGKVAAGLLASKAPWLTKALVGAGLYTGADMSVMMLSDVGEDKNMIRILSDTFPGVFGPKGRVPFPDWSKTLDSDSPIVRKWKSALETGPLSILGSFLGSVIALKGGKKNLSWLQPVDDSAKSYKQLEEIKSANPDKLIRAQKINELLATKSLSRQNEQILIDELLTIQDELGIVDDIDQLVKRDQQNVIKETNKAAERKLRNNKPEDLDFDPDVSSGIVDNPKQSVPPGNIARNIADTTAIKGGSSIGDPAPIITEAMRKKGLMVGPTSRGAVMGVAEETKDIGRFNAVVDGFRYTAKQMNAAAWDIYTSIIDPGASLDDVKALFLQNRDVKNMLLGRFKVETINEEQARAAAFALRDLTDQFLGREVATISEALTSLEIPVNEAAAMERVIDKMQFLMDEYGLNKYISGWQLRNKNWFDQVPPKELDTVIGQLSEEFVSAENAIHAKNMRFTSLLKDLRTSNPGILRPLVDAFAHTGGDVDTIEKLFRWAADQVTPTGLLKSPDPTRLNLFAKSMWGVRYNNVLSGLSAFRAGIGNTSQLILKPITAVLGHGVWGAADNFEGLKRTLYYNGAVFETNRRALSDAFELMKKSHKDPETMMKAYRKDFIIQESKTWDIVEQMRPQWEKEGNFGRILQYDIAKLLKQVSEIPYMRYGMTGMVAPDAFVNTHLAHYLSRVRAYDDVFSEFGFADWQKIYEAEGRHYATMFDSNRLPKDSTLKYLAGEVSLNLDDGLANYINKGTTAYPIFKDFMMFPRTSSNWIKNASSWTPISLIPGVSKYSKILYARTDDQIAEALAEHGINMATTPNAQVIFSNLRAEYTGRIAFSALLAKSLDQFAMGGNIRGNGHYNASRRMKERNEMGYEPKTINIGGKWVSYKGIPGVEQVLSIIGDIAYYRHDLDEPFVSSAHAKLAWTISATFLNETPLQGLEPLIAATNGDISGWNRLVANSIRSYLPLSSGAGVVAKAIDSAQKDLDGSIIQYVQNRLPVFNTSLSNKRDIWTGEIINDIDNPVLKVLNAINPLNVSDSAEPWRVWLMNIGWDGLSMLKKDSTGSYTYSPAERELIYEYIGEQQLYKKLIKLMNNKKWNQDIEDLRAHRSTNSDINNEKVRLDSKDLPLFQKIRQIVREAQLIAEQKLLELNPDIVENIQDQQLTDQRMKLGDVEGAGRLQQENLEKQTLLEYGGSR